MTLNTEDGLPDLSSYQVHSRREIVYLLRNVTERNQLVRMQTNQGADSVVTSILDVDEADNSVVIDCAPSALANQRILESSDISFETVLENIRILFFASQVQSCVHEDRPALRIDLPQSLIRLQRREFYRVLTPVANPVRCTLQIRDEESKITTAVVVPLYNVSGGGIAVTDEKKLVPPIVGSIYADCRIDIPGSPVVVTLQLMNSHELTLGNGKHVRRLGLMFVDPPKAMLAAIQRYITKLEREQNARTAGMG